MSVPAAILAPASNWRSTREVEDRVVKVEGIKTYATYAGKPAGGVFGDQDVPADVVGQIQLESAIPLANASPGKN